METKTQLGETDYSHTGGHLLHSIGFSIFSLVLLYLNFRMYFPLTNASQLPLRHFVALVAVFLFFLTLWAIHRMLLCFSDRVVGVISLLLFALLVLAQVFCIMIFKVKPTWDFGDVITAAKQISLGKPISYIKYFEIYPHNLKPAVLIGTFMKLFKGADWSFYLLNVLSISASIASVYFIVKKTLGIRIAALAMLLALLSTPLYLYAPIVYTDTLSLPYPAISLLFWLKWREASKKEDRRKQMLYFFLIAVVSAIGYLLKPVAAIVLFAALGEQFLTWVFKRLKKSFEGIVISLLSALLAFILVLGTFFTYADRMGYTKNISEDKAYPYYHWIMMGMNRPYGEGGTSYGYGGFSGEDYNYTKVYETKDARKAADISRIKERLKKFGAKGYVKFLMKKLEWTWTDPTFYAPVKLARKPLNNDIFHQWVLPNKMGRHIPYQVCGQLVHSLTLAMMLYGVVQALFTRRMAGFRSVMVLSCLGIMLFLLVWETRSRYLTFMIPVFIVMAADGLDSAFRGLDKLFGLY